MTDNAVLDKAAISRNFNRAARDYDRHAVLQDRVLDRLLEDLPVFRIQPQRILDLGSGTGRGADRLRRFYPRSWLLQLDLAESMLRSARRRRWFRRDALVLADAERLPLADAILDMVFSSLMMQWSQAPRDLLRGVHRALKPGGLFLFSTLGPDTLYELRESWRAADSALHIHPFADIQSLGNLLVDSGFSQPVLMSERLVLTYADLKSLMLDLREVGAVNSGRERRRTLTGKHRYLKCRQAYEQFRDDGKLPATYEVIYGHAWSAAPPGAERPLQFYPRGGKP